MRNGDVFLVGFSDLFDLHDHDQMVENLVKMVLVGHFGQINAQWVVIFGFGLVFFSFGLDFVSFGLGFVSFGLGFVSFGQFQGLVQSWMRIGCFISDISSWCTDI